MKTGLLRREELWATLRIGAPAMVARAMIPFMFTVDMVALGRIDGAEIGVYGLGVAPMLFIQFLVIGAVQPVIFMGAQALGANDTRLSGNIVRFAVRLVLLAAPVVIAIGFTLLPVFRFFGYPSELVRGAAAAGLVFSLGVPAIVLFLIGSYFLESLGRPQIAPLTLGFGIALNFFLNAPVIQMTTSFFNAPAAGAVLATVSVRWLLASAIWAYIWLRIDRAKLGLSGKIDAPKQLAARIWRAAGPTSTSYALEHGLGMAMVFIAGTFSAAALAGFQIAINFSALAGMAMVGMGVAASVRIGQAVGQGDENAARRAFASALTLGFPLAAPIAAITFCSPEVIANLFLAGSESIDSALISLRTISVYLITNGAYMISISANRAASNVRQSLRIVVLANVCVSTPMALMFAFILNFGVTGLVYGMICGSIVGAALSGFSF
ncbi:MAG: MATE family efflux transporter [Pseudomonadota bacterium]